MPLCAQAHDVTAENADSILAEWQALYGKASYADQMLFFNQRSDKGVNRSKAFKTTFQRAPLGSDDKLAAAVQQAIDEFVHEHILSLLVNHAGNHSLSRQIAVCHYVAVSCVQSV